MSLERSHDVIPQWTTGDRLRKARTIAGLTTRALAEEIGVSQKTITDAENNKRKVRKPVMMAYAATTGVSLHWLETGTPPHPDGPDGGVHVLRARRYSKPQPSDPKVRPLHDSQDRDRDLIAA